MQATRSGQSGPRLLFVEPYLTASHRAFAQGLMAHVPARWTLLGLPGRHFRWRMRGAALFLAQEAAAALSQPWDGLVCSSMLGLAELRGLAPALANTPALAVFHENQLAYPAPGAADENLRRRDLYLAFSNLATAKAARRVAFNSQFHRRQFLEAARDTLARLPDMIPQGLVDELAQKSLALPVPVEDAEAAPALAARQGPRAGRLRLLWNHRWEHDKGPEELFAALFALADQGLDFHAAIMGPRPAAWPKVFDQAADRLGERLAHIGPQDRREDYWRWLGWADVVVSTARQEYFGLSVAEAVWAGCMPLVPDALVYPELYPARCRYQPGQLAPALAVLMARPASVRAEDWRPLAQSFTWRAQAGAWRQLITEVVGR
ncbi:tRNA-queuosine alpha-mannosyltransferase domain-containing protein [Desulfarculus baarsii]